MPKNDAHKNDAHKNEKSVSAQAAATTPPAAEYTPPTLSDTADSTAPAAAVKQQSSRRLGTGAIIGLAAAGVALLAGVFGGGVALGAVAAPHGPGGMSHDIAEADGRMQGGPEQGGREQGGRMQGGPEQGGPEQGGPDGDGPMSPNMPHEHDANGMNSVPNGSRNAVTPSAAPTPAN